MNRLATTELNCVPSILFIHIGILNHDMIPVSTHTAGLQTVTYQQHVFVQCSKHTYRLMYN